MVGLKIVYHFKKGKTMKKTIMMLGLMLSLSACTTLNTATDVAANSLLVSMKIDSMQIEIGEYATNQQALDALDELQADVFETLTTGKGIENIYKYQARGKVIYSTLTSEITQRWGELTDEQQNVLVAIDAELIKLNSDIDSLASSTGLDENLINMMSQAVTLMSYYKVL
jgi:hypothetical protein